MDSSIEMELERINSYKDFSTRQGEMKMLIGDLIYSNDFDINCHYVVYDCRKENVTWDEAEVLYDNEKDYSKPLDWILDLKVKYITLAENCIVIEAK